MKNTAENELLSDWEGDLQFTIENKIGVHKLENQQFLSKLPGLSFIPNSIRYPRNQELIENKIKLNQNNLMGGGGTGANPTGKIESETNKINPSTIVPMKIRHPPKKYRKIRNLLENEMMNLNKSKFNGLDNSFNESFVNSIIQTFYFNASFRSFIFSHFCVNEGCLTCELSFLFYSLEMNSSGRGSGGSVHILPASLNPTNKIIVPNSNFISCLRKIPKAASRGFLQFSGNLKNKFNLQNSNTQNDSIRGSNDFQLIPNFLLFLFEQIKSDIIKNDKNSEAKIKEFEKTFATPCKLNKQCLVCRNEYFIDKFLPLIEFEYPAQLDSVDFIHLMKNSLIKNIIQDSPCRHCNSPKINNLNLFSSIPANDLPDLFIINSNITQHNHWKLWIPPPVSLDPQQPSQHPFSVPEKFYFQFEKNLSFQIIPGAAPQPGEERNYVQYQLFAVVCQIVDFHQQKHDKKSSSTASVPSANSRSDKSVSSASSASSILKNITTNHFVTHINVSCGQNDANSSGTGWHLFNDACITNENLQDVLKFAEWKIPILLVFQKVPHAAEPVQKIIPASSIKIADEVFFYPNPLDKYRIHDVPSLPNPIKASSELPKPGDFVAMDTEFVSLSPPQKDSKEGRLSLARVSVICFSGPNEKPQLIIDDYIYIKEPISDYKTRFSGILPGDLDPTISKYNVVSLKTVYLKLRILVDRGCIFVGHGLRKDFSICNLYVPAEQVRDTVDLFRLPYQRMISLRFLACHLLNSDIQTETHDSVEDAATAMRLYKLYLKLVADRSLDAILHDLYAKGRLVKWKLPSDASNLEEVEQDTTDTSHEPVGLINI